MPRLGRPETPFAALERVLAMAEEMSHEYSYCEYDDVSCRRLGRKEVVVRDLERVRMWIDEARRTVR